MSGSRLYTYLFHLILRSYAYTTHVDGLLPPNLRLVTVKAKVPVRKFYLFHIILHSCDYNNLKDSACNMFK